MGDVPNSLMDYTAYAVLSTVGSGSQVSRIIRNNALNFSAANLGNKVVIYVPMVVSYAVTTYGAMWLNGATSSGNVDAGLMDANGIRIANVGSTAQGTISVVQTANWSGGSVSIKPGTYYIAITQDNATGTLQRFISGSSGADKSFLAAGCNSETTGSFGVPATWSMTSVAQGVIPLVSIATQSTF
jgi:hypothetical protein